MFQKLLLFPRKTVFNERISFFEKLYLTFLILYDKIVYAEYAGVAELADAPDLGSGGFPVQVQVLSPAPNKRDHLTR